MNYRITEQYARLRANFAPPAIRTDFRAMRVAVALLPVGALAGCAGPGSDSASTPAPSFPLGLMIRE